MMPNTRSFSSLSFRTQSLLLKLSLSSAAALVWSNFSRKIFLSKAEKISKYNNDNILIDTRGDAGGRGGRCCCCCCRSSRCCCCCCRRQRSKAPIEDVATIADPEDHEDNEDEHLEYSRHKLKTLHSVFHTNSTNLKTKCLFKTFFASKAILIIR